MKINATLQGDVLLVKVQGNLLGGPDADTFYNKIKEHLDQGVRKFVVDMGGVKLMNSSGLGILIKSLKPVKEADGDLVLASVTEKINSLFMITKLYQVFRSFDNVEDAFAAF